MDTNQKRVSVWTVIISLLVGIISGIGTASIVYFVYQSPQLAMYKEQLDIMNESLVKRVQLEMEVVPRYDWESSGSSNGSFQLINTTLTLPRNNQTIFNVYVSNVGNAMAHLLYWTVTIFAPPNTVVRLGPIYDIQNIVLAPYGLYNMTYTYDPTTMGGGFNNEIAFTFALMSTESIVYETVNATFR
jgi:hypothetical protein